MADTTIGQITLVYCGETQQFTTVSLAAHFLRQAGKATGGWRQWSYSQGRPLLPMAQDVRVQGDTTGEGIT
jgi:hypothetical protein